MACRTKTINLAQVSVETLRRKAPKSENVSRMLEKSPLKHCQPAEYIPPPPRKIKVGKIQICRPLPVDYVHPPVPCICPPCPPCPTIEQQITNMCVLLLKLGTFYFLLEATRKENIWGSPDGTALIVNNFAQVIAKLFRGSAKEKDEDKATPTKVHFLEPDRIKFKLQSLWDKTIIFVFKWSIGVPVQLAHDVFQTIETSMFGNDEQPPKDDKNSKKVEKPKVSPSDDKATKKQ